MDIVQLVVQFGAVGIAVYLIHSQRKERSAFLRIIGNHITDNTKILQKLYDYLKRNGDS